MPLTALGSANDALNVPLNDREMREELRLVVELMALANRFDGARVPTAEVDSILRTVGLTVCRSPRCGPWCP